MTKNDGTKEYFARLKLAEEFTHGDLEKAKQMLSGEYQNIYIIKGRFKSSEKNIYGLYMLFLCEIENRLVRHHICVGTAPSIYQNSPGDNWPDFLKKIDRIIGQDLKNENLTERLSKAFAKVINTTSIPGLTKAVNDNSIDKITKAFTDILNKVMDTADTSAIVDYEKTTTMVLHDFFRSTNEESENHRQPASKPDMLSEEKIDIETLESSIQQEIIKARPVLSPVKGADIDTITAGDEIMAVIHDTSEAATATIQNLDLIHAGKTLPTPVTVTQRIIADGKIILYCTHQTAADVVFKIIERNGIRILMRNSIEGKQQENTTHEKKSSKKIVYGIFAVIFIIILVLFVYLTN